MEKAILTGLLFSAFFAAVPAQSRLTEHTFAYDSTAKVAAKIGDVAWLAGRWSGEGFGGWLEEIWSPPMAGQMLATFRMVSEGKPNFHEICMIAEEHGSLVYKVKHFNPDLTGWEEKDNYITFPFVKSEPNALYFNGLSLVKNGGTCTHYLAMKQKDGSYKEAELVYHKDSPERVFPQIHIPQAAENIARLKEINRDIWTPFMEAYAAGDAGKYIGLHTPDFIRANGGKWAGVKDLTAYRASSEEQFKHNKENNQRVEIAFTFFERATGESTATERGIYRYTSISADGERQHFYGKFHVFLRKINGAWKIAVDYDSDEDGRVGEADFAAGLPVEVFSK